MGLLRKADVRYPIILALLALILWAPRLRGPIDLRFDAGVYYVLGTSLAEGKGYRLLNEPGEISAVQYPPLLPAFVAVHQKILGTSDPAIVGRWLRRSYCAMFVMYCVAIYAMARRFTSAGNAFLVALICTVASDALYLSDLLFAELPFALLTVLFVLIWSPLPVIRERAGVRVISNDEHPSTSKSPSPQPSPGVPGEGAERSAVRFLTTALLGVMAFLLRSAGIALLGAWIGEAILKRQWKQGAIRAVIALVPLIAWQGWIGHVKSGDEYKHPAYAYQRAAYQFYNVTYAENLKLVDSFKPELGKLSKRATLERFATNLLIMPASLGESVSMPRSFWYWGLQSLSMKLGRAPDKPIVPWNAVEFPLVIFGGIGIAGMIILMIRKQWLVPLYIGASLFLICVTPWPKQLTRYFLPLAPFVALCVIQALLMLRERFKRAGPILFGVVIAAILIIELGASAAEWIVRFNRTGVTNGPVAAKLYYFDETWVSWNGSIDWINSRAARTDVIATVAPHLAYLKTGLKSIFPPMEIKPWREQELLDSVPARYVVVANLEFLNIDKRYALPMIENAPAKWRLVYTAPDNLTRVFERTN